MHKECIFYKGPKSIYKRGGTQRRKRKMGRTASGLPKVPEKKNDFSGEGKKRREQSIRKRRGKRPTR